MTGFALWAVSTTKIDVLAVQMFAVDGAIGAGSLVGSLDYHLGPYGPPAVAGIVAIENGADLVGPDPFQKRLLGHEVVDGALRFRPLPESTPFRSIWVSFSLSPIYPLIAK